MASAPPPDSHDDIPVCADCGEQHVTPRGHQACGGHVVKDRDTYVPGQPREDLPEPRACRKPPMAYLPVCDKHGGKAPQAVAISERAKLEARLIDGARKLIPDIDERDVVRDPLAKLLELASEADAFRESLRMLANRVGDEIRYGGTGAAGEQLRAEVSTYRAALRETADILVAIAKLDIENKLAASAVATDQMYHRVLAAILQDFGHNITEPEVARRVAGHLRAV